MDWQPIETAPRDGTAVLLYDGDEMMVGSWGYSDLYRYEPKVWIYGRALSEYNDYQEFYPTHWMPLPETPKK